MTTRELLSDTEVAWAAGFFDGEGSTYPNRRGRRLRLFCRLTNTNLAQLHRFHAAVGIGSIYKLKVRPGHRQAWVWQAERRNAEVALKVIWPYMGEEKRSQAEEALRQINEQPPPSLWRGRRALVTQTEQLPGIGP